LVERAEERVEACRLCRPPRHRYLYSQDPQRGRPADPHKQQPAGTNTSTGTGAAWWAVGCPQKSMHPGALDRCGPSLRRRTVLRRRPTRVTRAERARATDMDHRSSPRPVSICRTKAVPMSSPAPASVQRLRTRRQRQAASGCSRVPCRAISEAEQSAEVSRRSKKSSGELFASDRARCGRHKPARAAQHPPPQTLRTTHTGDLQTPRGGYMLSPAAHLLSKTTLPPAPQSHNLNSAST